MKKKKILTVLLAAALSLTGSVAQTRQLTVDAGKPGGIVQPTMYGIFFEDINFGADGGLYAEMVLNRNFEFPNHLQGVEHLWKGDRLRLRAGLHAQPTLCYRLSQRT